MKRMTFLCEPVKGENCGETYREADHVIEDRDPGLCLSCAVGA